MEPSANQYLAFSSSRSGPGVLVLHAWWGLNDFFKSLCNRLAAEGFIALAPDLYHGRVARTIEEAKALRSKLKGDQVEAEIHTALDSLFAQPGFTGKQAGVIGFSLGGRFALELSIRRPEAVGAVCVFYGNLGADFTGARAAYLFHFAEKDDYVAASGVKKLEKSLKAAGRPADMHVYPGTTHWFFEQDRRDAYHAQAAELAWIRTLEFLKQELMP